MFGGTGGAPKGLFRGTGGGGPTWEERVGGAGFFRMVWSPEEPIPLVVTWNVTLPPWEVVITLLLEEAQTLTLGDTCTTCCGWGPPAPRARAALSVPWEADEEGLELAEDASHSITVPPTHAFSLSLRREGGREKSVTATGVKYILAENKG